MKIKGQGYILLVDHLPSMHKAMGSTTNLTKLING